MERHLAICTDCREEYEAEMRLHEILRSPLESLHRAPGLHLTWHDILASMPDESDRAETGMPWSARIKEVWWPEAERALSGAFYWGKRVAVPAVSLIIVFLLFYSLHFPSPPLHGQAIRAVSKCRQMKINFSPGTTPSAKGYLRDTGKTAVACLSRLEYGWRDASRDKAVRINFAPSTAPVLEGYRKDVGGAAEGRTRAFEYGWKINGT